MVKSSLRLAASIVLVAPTLFAQGTGAYFNVESPQRKPITVARVQGHDYLVACNTPDNCVEIYDTHTNGFLLRMQTGAEPISVVYNATLGKLFTCNFLGDSISVIALSAPGPSGPLSATLERTTLVGDEPNHIAFAPGNASLFVTLSSSSAIGHRLTSNLLPVSLGSERIDLVDNVATPTEAIKDPCTALVQGTKLYVLGHRGGKGGQSLPASFFDYDFDVRAIDLQSGTITRIKNLGTINFNMAFAQSGELWVVGTDAQFDLIGETAVRNAPFGFVRSVIWKIASPGQDLPTAEARDLNADTTGAQVPKTQALAQPTDLALYEPGGTLQKIYVAAFNSDLLGVIVPSGPASSWTITQTLVPKAPLSPNPMSGPRGLAVKYASGLAGDPGDRVYVLNRIDNSFSVVDPTNDAAPIATFALQRDPTPQYVRTGREFLYGAQHSGNGIVSCASCHIDGRSDWLRWNLSDNSDQPFPALIKDGVVNNPSMSTSWPPNKDFMITQTLQGMVNFETLPAVQSWFTNEPLHWRADRASFVAFNPAFVNLLGNANQLATGQMEAFRDFVFSIAYPPNPEELPARVLSGTLGSTSDETQGTDAKRGLKLFHMKPLGNVCAGRACVQCHWLPEGSNNKITELVANVFNTSNRQPLETAGIRLLRQKERILEKNGSTLGTVKLGIFGLAHEGTFTSINTFVQLFQGDFDDDGTPGLSTDEQEELNDLKQFVREVDTGVGPMVGQPFSVDVANKNNPRTTLFFNLAEGQAGLANHGVAVQARLAGVQRGFWYDVTASGYHEEPSGVTFSRAKLLAFVATSADLLVVHVTPLGSERRFAWQGPGVLPALTGPDPSGITLQPMGTNTAYQDVPLLSKNWIPVENGGTFDWTGDDTAGAATPPFVRAIRLFQWGLVQDGPQFGLTALRHEAPRRFRVAVNNARHGAKLRLKLGNDPNNAPPNSTTFVTFELPIYPTSQFSGTARIWETAVEIEPLRLYMLMLGGPLAPHVRGTIDGTFVTGEPPLPGSYDPTVWNQYVVEVVNESGNPGSGGWQPLRIQ